MLNVLKLAISALLLIVVSNFSVYGSPIALEARDVFSPPILSPNAETVWRAGRSENVTWDASNPPSSISNAALIVLRTAGASKVSQRILAANFSLLAGVQQVLVPGDLPTRHDYEIMLFGDSGNISPQFKILK